MDSRGSRGQGRGGRGQGRGGRGRGRQGSRGGANVPNKRARFDNGNRSGRPFDRDGREERVARVPLTSEEISERKASSKLLPAIDEAAVLVAALPADVIRASWSSVAIQCYRNQSDDFAMSASMKKRFSDFHVNEIAEDGSIVQLTNRKIPDDIIVECEQADVIDEESVWSSLAELCPNINALKEFSQLDTKPSPAPMILGEFNEKESRGKVHSLIKQLTSCRFFSDTVINADESRSIRVSLGKPATNNFRPKHAWPGGDRDFLQFVLFKENVETMKAVTAIGQVCQLATSRFSYAGNKDRRGVTSQLVTVFKVSARDMVRNMSRLRSGVAIGNFQYVKEALKLGSLKGNQFRVVLRDITLKDEERNRMEARLDSLQQLGFINYFGLQRFGTEAVSTHWVGRAILQNKFDLAVGMLLVNQPSHQEELQAALTYLHESLDYLGAVDKLSSRNFIERSLLLSLSKCPTDFTMALESLPRNMRLLYVHAYQSFIWNKMTNVRLSKFRPDQPIIGDLVLDPNDSTQHSVIVIDENNIGQFSIFDVMLPLPGCDIVLPVNEIGKTYIEELSKDNITLESLDHRVKNYKISGDYRKLVVRPADFTYEFVRYDNHEKALLRSDIDRIKGINIEDECAEGANLALRMKFSLPSSAYATMLVREVLHCQPNTWQQGAAKSDTENFTEDSTDAPAQEEAIANDLNVQCEELLIEDSSNE